MNRQKLIEQIKSYKPYNEQEEKDKPLILEWIRNNDNAFLRENTVAHVTASAWVVNKDRSKVLMVYHNIYDSWSWLGGHADGETDLLAVAVREVKEEAGISEVHPLTEEIFSLESLTVDGHVKNGGYVSSHLHLNITYLLEADSEEAVSIKEDENSGVSWFSSEEALKKSTEPWFVKNVYTKLIRKTERFILPVNKNYIFRRAEPDEVGSVFQLYKKRIQWMDRKGICQWNTTGYLETYPVDYYVKQQILGNLYVLIEGNAIIGAVVLLQEDDRWSDKKALPAFYVHNLVTDFRVSGAGEKILMESEKLAINKGKYYVRLDCAVNNVFLNNYYDSLGYKIAGICQDGAYIGNRREKFLK